MQKYLGRSSRAERDVSNLHHQAIEYKPYHLNSQESESPIMSSSLKVLLQELRKQFLVSKLKFLFGFEEKMGKVTRRKRNGKFHIQKTVIPVPRLG